MPDAGIAKIEIGVPRKRMPLCRLLLTYGIRFSASPGISVTDFLLQSLPLDADYLQNRIQTIFLDGHPVDHPDHVHLHQTATLSLSAAMPGLFGAAFRKNGRFGPLRRQADSHGALDVPVNPQIPIIVTVKCFNAVAASLGDLLLEQGIRMDIGDILRFWRRHLTILQRDCRWILLEGLSVTTEHLVGTLQKKRGDASLEVTALE